MINLRPQGRERADDHAVGARVGILARCREDHHKDRRLHANGVDPIGKAAQRPHSFLDKGIAAKLDFDQPIATVPQMDNRIALEP